MRPYLLLDHVRSDAAATELARDEDLDRVLLCFPDTERPRLRSGGFVFASGCLERLISPSSVVSRLFCRFSWILSCSVRVAVIVPTIVERTVATMNVFYLTYQSPRREVPSDESVP